MFYAAVQFLETFFISVAKWHQILFVTVEGCLSLNQFSSVMVARVGARAYWCVEVRHRDFDSPQLIFDYVFNDPIKIRCHSPTIPRSAKPLFTFSLAFFSNCIACPNSHVQAKSVRLPTSHSHHLTANILMASLCRLQEGELRVDSSTLGLRTPCICQFSFR